MFVIEIRDAANKQLHSQASIKARRAWQLPNISGYLKNWRKK